MPGIGEMPKEVQVSTQPNQNESNNQQPPAQPPEALTFEKWAEGFSPEHKALFDAHVGGLKKAVETERDRAKELDKQLKALAAKADKGSDMESQIAKLQADLATQTARSEFILAAPGKQVVNVDAAWKLANADGLIGKDGADWDALKKQYPELFQKTPAAPPPATNAGSRNTAPAVTDADLVAAKKATGQYRI